MGTSEDLIHVYTKELSNEEKNSVLRQLLEAGVGDAVEGILVTVNEAGEVTLNGACASDTMARISVMLMEQACVMRAAEMSADEGEERAH